MHWLGAGGGRPEWWGCPRVRGQQSWLLRAEAALTPVPPPPLLSSPGAAGVGCDLPRGVGHTTECAGALGDGHAGEVFGNVVENHTCRQGLPGAACGRPHPSLGLPACAPGGLSPFTPPAPSGLHAQRPAPSCRQAQAQGCPGGAQACLWPGSAHLLPVASWTHPPRASPLPVPWISPCGREHLRGAGGPGSREPSGAHAGWVGAHLEGPVGRGTPPSGQKQPKVQKRAQLCCGLEQVLMQASPHSWYTWLAGH